MKEEAINIWDAPADAICITTNGCFQVDGTAIMGGGIALEARMRDPDIAHGLGLMLRMFGNHAFVLKPPLAASGARPYEPAILSFPTKNHPANMSDLSLIRRSAAELVEITDDQGYENVYIPRPGCGLGGLDWEKEVKHLIKPLLDDRFTVVTFP